jgi:hypothetical protein
MGRSQEFEPLDEKHVHRIPDTRHKCQGRRLEKCRRIYLAPGVELSLSNSRGPYSHENDLGDASRGRATDGRRNSCRTH